MKSMHKQDLPQKQSNRKESLAGQIIRTAWMSWFAVIIGFFLYNYHLSTKTFEAELERNFNQTARIAKQLMENRLQTIQVTQDITSRSRTLIDLFDAGDYQAIDNYMFELEEVDPHGVSDFRFMFRYGNLVWDDGHATFYGLTHQQLSALEGEVDYNNKWYFLAPSKELGNKHIMIRRSSLINSKNGELVGYYYVGLVMDNNLSLLQDVIADANISEIMLVEGGDIIASSSAEVSQKLQQQQELKLTDHSYFGSEIINQVDVVIGGVKTPIKAVFLQDTSKLERVEYSFAASLLFALLTVSILAVIITKSVQRRVEREIEGVMHLADSFDSAKKSVDFKGSNIAEFDRLGKTLLTSIQREQQKETSFKNLFDFSVLPTVLLNNEKKLLELNPAAIEAFANDRGAKTLKRHLDKHLDLVLETQKIAEVDSYVGDQVYRWSIAPILVDGAAPTLVIQGRSITQFIEAERQSERARKEAEQTAVARAEFLAKVSHEIRTPLNGILGMAQLLKDNANSDEQKQQTQVLYQSSEHLLNLLNDILDFSRIDKGGEIIEYSNFSLNQVLETVTSFAKPSCQQKSLNFVVNKHFDGEIMVKSDQMRLTQIFLNLLTNAIKFTAKGAVVVDVELRNQLGNRALLCFMVTDTGIGIAQDKLESVFSSFTQADVNISREYGGSGLGLSIVKSLVSHLNGSIKVDSQLGNGSCFSVVLPIEMLSNKALLDTASELPACATQPSLINRNLRILLVEDNKTNAFVVQALGKKHGLEFDWVTDGLQAIAKVQSQRYDLILMDNQMPKMDGIEVTKKLREELNITTPVVACTADGYQSTEQAFMSAGANAVLVKPIIEDKFLQVLQQVLESSTC
ncbi:LuxQ periplasmic sensor domain-containing protein [Vibrio sp. B1Z05]|uniref:LuxQ periplasmic sensor domain-containing protein n=1 Tax=Vibrio sp. B1Z05 TaxID=2654980 RepID=UPI0020A6CE83|nr:LuxQ periplasmic sensor domain-containing protein [Vibrio sp. B1Z05]